MRRSKRIPAKPRFKKARNHAYDLLKRLGVGKFPVDPFCVTDYYPNIHLFSYTHLKRETGCPDPFGFDKKNAGIDHMNTFISDPKKKLHHVDGQTVIARGSNDFIIVYDDRIANERRIRWTIAHELGHIFCGHLKDFEETALNRGGLTKAEYGVLEVEANWFVTEFLSPRAVLRVFSFDKPCAIALLCDISKAAAEKRFKELQNREYNYDSNEILRNFYAHLVSGEYQKVIYENLCEFAFAPFYDELTDACRICKDCGAIISNNDAVFCYYCGQHNVVDVHTHRVSDLLSNGAREVADGVREVANGAREVADAALPGSPTPPSSPAPPNSLAPLNSLAPPNVPYSFAGKIEHGTVTDKGRLLYCPRCMNSEFSDKARSCRICGAPLVNRCPACLKLLSVACRYCPDCGHASTLKPLYDRERSTVKLPEDYDDYIAYDYWDFIKLTIGYWHNGDISLYARLSDSIVFRDDGDFIIATPHRHVVAAISSNLSKVKENITKYGKSTVDTIRVICTNER